jgi:hypothetical protein
MLEQPISALFLRMIPEGILLFYAIYAIINLKGNTKKIICSGVALGISNYLVRMLPINFGVHTMLALIIYIGICSKFHKIETFKSIKICLTSMALLFISDAILMFIYINGIKVSQEALFDKTIQGTLLSLPSLVIFVLMISIVSIYNNRKFKKVMN